jgi:hypothetical protein
MSAPPPKDLADVDHIPFSDLEKYDQRLRVCPDWRKENINSIGLYRLTNYAHPVFEATRFIGRRFSIQDTQQARLFASRMLEADFSLPFWWALMSGDAMRGDPALKEREAKAATIPRFPNEPSKIPGQEMMKAWLSMVQARTPNYELALISPPRSLTSRKIAKTKADLRELAEQITWVVGDDADGSRCTTSWLSRAPFPFRGSPSRIIINAQELRMHSDAMQGDLVCQVWASVSFGFKLLQLLAHAAVGAARSGAECNWTNMYRFAAGAKKGSEVRMLNTCTFGGVLRYELEHKLVAKSHYTLNGAEGVPGLWFAFSDFPGEDVLAMSGTVPDGYSFSARDSSKKGPFYHREWQVSYSWLLRLLTDAFWNKDVRTRGQAALAPPKEVGYVMHRDGRRKYGPLHADVIRRGIVPSGYRMIPRSYVMAKKSLDLKGRPHIKFGGFDIGRMTFDSDDEMYREQSSSESESNEPWKNMIGDASEIEDAYEIEDCNDSNSE